MDLEKCLAAVGESMARDATKPAPPTDEEIVALLDFTRAVAHASERKDAPLAAFAVGIATAGLSPAQRVEVLTRSAAAIDRAAGNAQ